MGSDFVTFQQDPSWGNIGASIARSISGAPKAALDQTMTVEQILALRQKQKQDKAAYDANITAGNATASALAGVGPPTSERDVVYQPQGPANPADTPAPDENTPLGNAFLPTTTMKEQYVDPKVQARYDRELPMFQGIARAKAFGDAGGLPGIYSRGSIALGGAPTDPAEMQRLSGITTGTVAPLKGEPFVAKTQDGKTVAILGMSPDGGVHTMDGRLMKDIAPPGSIPVQAGAVNLNEKPHSIFADAGTRLAAILDGTNNILAGKLPNPAETRILSVAVREQYPTVFKVMSDAVGNTIELRNFIEKEAPPELQPLLKHIVNTLPEYRQTAAAAPAPGADPAAVAAAQPPALAPPGTRPAAGPQPNVLVSAPASQAQVNLASAITRADSARNAIEKYVFAGADPATGALPQKPWLPDWRAALLAERSNDSIAIRKAIDLMDPDARDYYAHAKAWIEPVLRLASGAAIRPEEYRDYMTMFIPNWGDSPQLVASKLTRMREWQAATGGNVTATQAVATMIEKAKVRGDTEAIGLAQKMLVRAQEAGRANIPRDQLPPPTGAQAGGTVSPGPNPAIVDSIKRAVRPTVPQEP